MLAGLTTLLVHETQHTGQASAPDATDATDASLAAARAEVDLAQEQQAGEDVTMGAAPPLGAPEGYPARGLGLPALFLAGVVIWTGAIGAAASMWPNAMAHLGYSQQTISSLWGLAALVELPGMLGAGILSDAIGRAPLLAAGAFGVSLVFLGYVFVAQWLPALIGVQMVRGLSYGSYTASAMTFAAEHGSRRTRGSVSGVFAAATGAGQLAGTFTGGLVVQAFGFTPLFTLCAAAAVVGGICFLSLYRRTRLAVAATAEMPNTPRVQKT
jgi:MFS family permease